MSAVLEPVSDTTTDLVPVAGEVVEAVLVEETETAIAPLDRPHPADRSPYWVYLGGMDSDRSRVTMRGCLDRLAHLAAGAPLPRPGNRKRSLAPIPATVSGADIPWEQMGFAHVARLRALVAAQGWAPAYANLHLSALRGVLATAVSLRLMSRDDHALATDRLKPIKGSRPRKGRQVDLAEIRAHLTAAAVDGTPKSARDAALLALGYGTGARRAELVAADLADWKQNRLLLKGKGDKHRIVPIPAYVRPIVAAWLHHRGMEPGPLLCRVGRWGGVVRPLARLSGQTVADVLHDRARQAGSVAPVAPHDMRRTYAGHLLDDPEVDLVTARDLMGHASVVTTSAYDRRGEQRMEQAVNRLPNPFAADGADPVPDPDAS